METSSRRLLAALVLSTLVLSSLPLALPPACAADEGPTGPWTLPVRMDNAAKGDRTILSVRMVMDDDGSMFATWLDDRADGNDCWVTYSPDGGATWTSDVRVDPLPNQGVIPSTAGIGTDSDGHVWATYSQRMVQGYRVRFARSDDGGVTFRTPANVYEVVDESEKQLHPAMAVSSHGSLYILFLDDTATSDKLFLVRSDDGLNPLAPRAVEAGAPESVQHIQGDIAVTPDGDVYVAYGYRETGTAGIKVARKPASASTFAVVTAYTIEEDVPRELRPRLAVSNDGEVVEVAFHPGDAGAKLQHMRSSDGGTTFTAPKAIWGSGEAGDEQRDPSLAFDSLGRLHVVWAQGGDRPVRALHSMSLDGVSFTSPTRLSGAWNESEMGLRAWEDLPVIVPTADGSLAAAFAGKMNETVGVWFTKLENRPPLVTITYPTDGAAVKGTVPILGTAMDPAGTTGLDHVYVKVGDADPRRLPGTTSWEHEFDSTPLPDGMLTIRAWAGDGFLLGPEVVISVDVDNNAPPTFSIGTPANHTKHVGTVRIAGAAFDAGGFMEGWTVQYKLEDGDWTDVVAGNLLDDNNLDYEVELDLSDLASGDYEVQVRVSDGDKFSQPKSVTVEMDNRPDLYVDPSGISWEPLRPKHGEPVSISITVENRGVVMAERFEVDVRRGSQVVGLQVGSNLPPGETETLSILWDPAKGGNNSMLVTLDPKRLVDELGEDDNEARFYIEVERPPEVDEDSPLPYILIVVAVVVVLALVGFFRWKLATIPEEVVDTIVDGEDMYTGDAQQGTAVQTPPEGGPPQGGGATPDGGPSLDHGGPLDEVGPSDVQRDQGSDGGAGPTAGDSGGPPAGGPGAEAGDHLEDLPKKEVRPPWR